MKKVIFGAFGLVFLALVINSCGKKTKDKFSGEWRVVEYANTTVDPNEHSKDSPATPNTLTIKEDGTWIWERKSSYYAVVFGGTVHLTSKKSIIHSGTWSFAEKITDFKKSECVIFHTLSEQQTSSQTGGGTHPIFPDTTVSSSNTYLTGEKSIVYTITISTGEELELVSESSGTVKFFLKKK
jgi:hypothetical protein